MGKIAVLPPALASQIAAGEVVERPASALKELLENALDAGARRCDVAMEAGGIGLLAVRDDGTGMSPDDARRALERHATSKLKAFEDLSGMRSYGFRGEALPSIASVSRFSLKTRAQGDDAGTQVTVEAGGEPEISEVGMAVGTQVEVRDLFFNVPARRKFLRSSATEAGHVTDVVENAALACPDVTFTLERDGRRSREWLRSGSRAERVRACFSGEELAECVGERGPLLLEAHLSRPERARTGAGGLKLLCNNRPIRDRAILATIAQAYGSVLERGRYPRGVVYIDLPPELVDANVHPQKTEVRFADSRAVTDAVYQIMSGRLSKAFSAPMPTHSPGGAAPPTPSESPHGEREGAALDAAANSRSTERERGAGAAFAPGRSFSRSHEARAYPSANVSDGSQRSLFLGDRDAAHPSSTATAAPAIPATVEPSEPASLPSRDESSFAWSRLRFVAQVKATYLLCEGHDALYIIDQHAAAERVTFHRLREQYKASSLTSQSLLFPLTLEVTAEQSELIEAKHKEVEDLGFELRVHSENTVSLHAIPKLLQRGSPERLVHDLLLEMSRSGRAFSDAVDGVLSTMACHGSIRSGDALSQQEASALLLELDKVDFAGHCPHGRPIVASTPWAELERKVGRR